MGDARPDRLHHARPLMAEHHGNREGYGPVHHGQIAVTQSRRGDRDPHLTGPRLPHLQVVHDPGPLPVEHHTTHPAAPLQAWVSLGSPSTRSAMIVRWIWSEPP
ncbi:hypothetical protein RKD49_003594 [Streptomyces glaucescens]